MIQRILFGIFILSSVMFAPVAVVHAAQIVPPCNTGPLEVKTYEIVVKNGQETKIPKEKNFAQPCDFSYVILLLNNIIKFLLFTIATPLAALGLIYAGFKLLTSGGSSEAKTKAKAIIKNIIIGYIVALAAWLVVNTIFKTFGFTDDSGRNKEYDYLNSQL